MQATIEAWRAEAVLVAVRGQFVASVIPAAGKSEQFPEATSKEHIESPVQNMHDPSLFSQGISQLFVVAISQFPPFG